MLLFFMVAFLGMTGVVILLLIMIQVMLLPYRNKILRKANKEADRILREGTKANREHIENTINMFKVAHAIKEINEIEANKMEKLIELLVTKGVTYDE